MLDAVPLSNWLGLFALVSYIFTLLPTIIKIVFPRLKATKASKWLQKNRRCLGILTFWLALAHGILLAKQRDFDFFDGKAYWIYIQGVAPFTILALLAITSNDWSVKKLKKNWKRLHQLTYIAMLILTWHVTSKMYGHWTYITPLGIVGSAGIAILCFIRLWGDRRSFSFSIKSKEQTTSS